MVRLGRERLSGTVEVDETYIGGEKPGKRGRRAESKVFIGKHRRKILISRTRGKRIDKLYLVRFAQDSWNEKQFDFSKTESVHEQKMTPSVWVSPSEIRSAWARLIDKV